MNTWFAGANVLWVVAATFAALATGTAVRLAALRGAAREIAEQRLASLRSWWVVAIVVVGAALLGPTAAALLFTAVSVLALSEFSRLWKTEALDRRLVFAAYGADRLGACRQADLRR